MLLKSKRVYFNEGFHEAVVEIKDHKIVNIFSGDHEFDVDYGNDMILPGFIDIHTHGYKGVNANRPTLEGMKMWADSLIDEGVLNFLATTATQAYDNNIAALKIISEYMSIQDSGANVVGINIEGNFIDETYRGAQDINTIVKPDKNILKDYIVASNHNIKSVICAVEHDDNLEFLKYAVEKNVAVSVGHSGALYHEVDEAIKHGLTGATHTGNGMRPFHHREPGVFGASMGRDELFAEVIVDGLHLHFEVVNIIGRLKGKDKLVLITDSSSYKDYAETEEGYVRVIGADGSIRDEKGDLSGSSLKFNKGVYNAIHKAKLDVVTVLNGATINPATYLNIHDHKGLIEIGYDADIIVVNDEFDVLDAYVSGVNVNK